MSLSVTMSATRSGRKPAQPGSTLASRRGAAFARCSAAARSSRNEPCQPGLRAGMVSAIRSWSIVAAGQVEQRVGVGDAEPPRPRTGLDDRVAGPDVALGDHAHVEAGAVVADQQRRHVGLVEADPDPDSR